MEKSEREKETENWKIKPEKQTHTHIMDRKILCGFLITILLALNQSVVGDQDEDIPHNE